MTRALIAGLAALAVGVPAASAASPLVPQACLKLKKIDGTDRADRIRGGRASERIFAFGGNDRIEAGAGNDCVFGGDGGALIEGGPGNDTLEGRYGVGNGPGRDLIAGGRGDDTIDGWDGDDGLAGGPGADRIEGWSGDDILLGGPGNDAIGGGSGHNFINGGPGNDRISAVNGVAEKVRCGRGRDLVRADPADRVIGCERVRRMKRSPLPAASPHVGGPQSTFVVDYKPPLTGLDSVVVVPPCRKPGAGLPWQQLVPFTPDRLAVRLQLPRPLPRGWCAGRYTGKVVRSARPSDTGYPCPTRAEWKRPSQVYVGRIREDQCGRPASLVGRFGFTVRSGVRTRLPEPPCRPAGSKTLAENATARVFSARLGKYTFFYGCLFTVRADVLLSGTNQFGDLQPVSLINLAGPYTGFAITIQGPASGATAAGVVDLRTGLLARGGYVGDLGLTISSVVMKDNGSVAWIGTGMVWDPAVRNNVNIVAVGKSDAGGNKELDRGEGIDQSSLRLDGSSLTWTKDGAPQSATLD